MCFILLAFILFMYLFYFIYFLSYVIVTSTCGKLCIGMEQKYTYTNKCALCISMYIMHYWTKAWETLCREWNINMSKHVSVHLHIPVTLHPWTEVCETWYRGGK